MPDQPKPRPVGSDGTVFRCPICKAVLPGSGTTSFPFCSDRCRLLDLNNWLDGTYTASRPIDPTDQIENMPRIDPPRRENRG
jgi:endogenous inhibitor of DNA gyrase (YacG/DUF329 family)